MSAKFLIACLVVLGGCSTLSSPPAGQAKWEDWQLDAGKMKCMQKQEYPGSTACDAFDTQR